MSAIPPVDPNDPPSLEPLRDAWQAVLRIQDWDIEVSYRRHLERSSITLRAAYKRAVVELMHPLDWDDRLPYDVEKQLVHELCHVHFAPLDTRDHSTLHGFAEEQAVESFARALVSLKRFLTPPEAP